MNDRRAGEMQQFCIGASKYFSSLQSHYSTLTLTLLSFER
jgi:hypothetical protein